MRKKQKIDCSPEVKSSTQHQGKENFLTKWARNQTHTVEGNFLANVHPVLLVMYYFAKHRLCIIFTVNCVNVPNCHTSSSAVNFIHALCMLPEVLVLKFLWFKIMHHEALRQNLYVCCRLHRVVVLVQNFLLKVELIHKIAKNYNHNDTKRYNFITVVVWVCLLFLSQKINET